MQFECDGVILELDEIISSFTPKKFKVGKEEKRSLSGKLKQIYLTEKYQFALGFEMLSYEEYSKLEQIYDKGQAILFTHDYRYDEAGQLKPESCNVIWTSDLDPEIVDTDDGVLYFNLNIQLEEV